MLQVLERPEVMAPKSSVASAAGGGLPGVGPGPGGLGPLGASLAAPDAPPPANSPRRKAVTVPPRECSGYCPVIVGGEDPDPLIRQKRDKVKEVSGARSNTRSGEICFPRVILSARRVAA